MTKQHSLKVLEIFCRKKRVYTKKIINKELKIRWRKLKDKNKNVFTKKLIEIGVWNIEGNLNESGKG